MRESIAVVGPGRLGRILVQQLARAGYKVVEIIARDDTRALGKAQRLARGLKARASSITRARLDADVIWFCVPDSKVAHVARELSTRNWHGKISLHSSGGLTSDALESLRKAGASVASVHPLMTFVHGSRPSLAAVPFAVEGDPVAQRMAGRIIQSLGGEAFAIRKRDKTAYHAFATLVCPLLISLLATSEKVAQLCGISEREVRRRTIPIIRQTFANYEQMGPASAFSGPIVRGDAETIAAHLSALDRVPEAKLVYAALARAALKYLPSKNRGKISELLVANLHITRRSVKDTGRGRKRRARRE